MSSSSKRKTRSSSSSSPHPVPKRVTRSSASPAADLDLTLNNSQLKNLVTTSSRKVKKVVTTSPNVNKVVTTSSEVKEEVQTSFMDVTPLIVDSNNSDGEGPNARFIGEPVPDPEARQRWPKRYEDKVIYLFIFFTKMVGNVVMCC